jgi:predicted MFS family arabinose efflux permease
LLFSRFNRKRMLLVSLLMFTLSSFASAYVTDFNVLLMVRMIPALFHPVFFSLAFVSAVALYPPEQAARASSHAFLGTSIGIVLGVPIVAWVGSRFSYESAFHFTAAVNLLALLGVLLLLPQMPTVGGGSTRNQLGILKKPTLWLNVGSTGLIFAGMFAVYSYAAEYLKTVGGMSADSVSFLLVLFGLGGIGGNMLAGRVLGRSKIATVIAHPIAIALGLLLLLVFNASITPMTIIMIFWGAAHTSSLVITQIWLTSEAPEAPEFATSIFASIANLGVAVGSAIGGWFIKAFGMSAMFWAGWMLLAGALALILIRVSMMKHSSRAKAVEPRAA